MLIKYKLHYNIDFFSRIKHFRRGEKEKAIKVKPRTLIESQTQLIPVQNNQFSYFNYYNHHLLPNQILRDITYVSDLLNI